MPYRAAPHPVAGSPPMLNPPSPTRSLAPPPKLGPQDFKIKFAQARAGENPDLADIYARKVESMKAQGEASGGRGRRRGWPRSRRGALACWAAAHL
jgi:hypothetical protein